MNINYRIISVDNEQHSIVVRYSTDVATEDYLAYRDAEGNITGSRGDFNINIWTWPAPTGQALQDLIEDNAPVEWLGLIEKSMTGEIPATSLDGAKAVKGTQFKRDAVALVAARNARRAGI